MDMILLKRLTGTTLSLLLCTLIGYPAIARPLAEGIQNQDVSETDGVQPKRGEIISVASNLVTIEMDNGEVRTIAAARWHLSELRPGREVWVAYNRIVGIEPREQ